MSNPFYPPKRTHAESTSRGSIGTGLDSQPIAFDPDRRAGNLTRFQQATSSREHLSSDELEHHQRKRTEGPGGASLFYSQDAPVGGDMPAFGTGTDGFGGPVQEQGSAERRPFPYDAPDYRHEYTQRQDKNAPTYNGQQMAFHYPHDGYNRQHYQTPAYEQSPQVRTLLLEEDSKGGGLNFPDQHSQEHLHQYPPQPSLFPQASFMGPSSRPSTPGYYPDRAPKLEKLTESQKKIAKSFPSDLDEENGSLLKTGIAMAKDWKSWLKWKYTHYYLLLIVIALLVALMTIYHHQIIDWLTPVSQKVRSVVWGWVIPVVILFIISFPPLFGHEIIGILLGVVYGLWVGFGILSLGTLLGEWGNFYAFKYFLQKHGERYERKSLNYACMAYIVREGGFLVILLARLSAIPGHFTTAVFATVGMGFFVFTLATILSMPKQLLVVYLGVVLEQSGAGNEPTRSKVIKYVVLVLSGLVTVGVAIFLYGKMQQARPTVQARLRERRFVLLTEADGEPTKSNEEGVGGAAADESTTKLYGQGTAGLYSTDDLESSRFSPTGKSKVKGASRWKWGKKRRAKKTDGMPERSASAESLEKAEEHGQGGMRAEGARLSFEAESVANSDTLKEPSVRYITPRPQQPFAPSHQTSGQQHRQQDYRERGQFYPQSAPLRAPSLPNPYDEQSRPAPSTPFTAPTRTDAGDYNVSFDQTHFDGAPSAVPPYSRAM